MWRSVGRLAAGVMSAADTKAGGNASTSAGSGKAAGKGGPLHSGRLAGMAFMQRAAQRKQLQQRKEQAVLSVALLACLCDGSVLAGMLKHTFRPGLDINQGHDVRPLL